MKKIKLLILMLLMSLALVACDGEEAPKDNDKEVVEDTKEPEATLTVTKEPTTEPTTEPTLTPTEEPTIEPTVEPTVEPTKEPEKDELEIHFIECGNGDAIYLECGDSTMLIDAGDEKGEVTSYLSEELEGKLDYIILTHPHADHLTDMSEIVSEYTDSETKIIVSPATNNTKMFEEFLDAVADEGLKLTKAESGTEYELGDAAFTILGPVSDEYSDLNDYSVGVYLQYNEFTFLTMGDAEGKAEQEMLDTGIIKKVDLYKACHHGSWQDEANSTVLNQFKPTQLVVTCSKREDNTYGHPHIELIDYAIKNSVFTYLTGYQGDVVFRVKGNSTRTNVMAYESMAALLVKPTLTPTVTPTKAPTTKAPATKAPTKAPTVKPTIKPTVKPTAKPTAVPSVKVWISATGSKYHSINNCGKMNPNKATQMSKEQAESQGYTACSKCY